MNDEVNKNMHLLIVALLDDHYLDDVILGLTSVSGGQVTSIDAVSGTQNLSQAIPMFAEFLGMGGKRFCKIMFTCVSDSDPASRLIEELRGGGLDFTGLSLGEVYTVPLAESIVIDDFDVF